MAMERFACNGMTGARQRLVAYFAFMLNFMLVLRF